MTSSAKKTGIAIKLMVAPVIVAVLLLAFGVFSHMNMLSFQRGMEDLLKGSVANERLAQETEAAVNATHAAAYRSLALLNLNSEKAAKSAADLMTQQMTALDETDRALAASAQPEIQAMAKIVAEYEKAVADAYDAATSDTNLGAMMMQDADKVYDKLIETLQGTSAASRIAASRDAQAMDQRMTKLETVQAGVLLLAILIGLALAYIAGQTIAKPLRSMQAQIAEIESSADFSRRVQLSTRDEVGQTADSFNNLISTLHSAVQEVNSVVGAVAVGDFSRRITTPLKGDMGVMKAAVNNSAESVKATMDGLNALMQALQHGNFSTETNDSLQGEYGRAMAQATAAMASLRTMLGDVGRVMQGVAEGKLGRRVEADGKGDLQTLKHNINLSLDAMANAMRNINANARQVATASAQSSQAIGQISDGAMNQTHALGQVTAAVRQTVTSVSDVSRNTEVASQKSKESVAIVRDGMRKMERMVEVVNNIALNSEKINKITEVIEKIANKTNLLSLNAAIEAARAGEHGKGFAVVADEVGKLAMNSAESSQEIAQLVQKAVAETRMAVLAVKEVSADMARIESGSQETDSMLQRISAALEQQSTAVEEINANLTSVDSIARNNAAASEQITETVMELSKIADATRREVEKFTL